MIALHLLKNFARITLGVTLLGLFGCAASGDLGRRKPGLLAEASAVDFIPSRINSNSSLTDDERELRNRLFALVHMPRPLPMNSLLALPDELDQAIGPDPDFYYLSIAGSADRSPTARYSRLLSDISSDRVLIPKFREIACRVEQTDKTRSEATAAAPALSQTDHNDVQARINENNSLIEKVEAAIPKRFEAYHAALEHLAAASPDVLARKVLSELNALNVEAANSHCGQVARRHIVRKG
ncbi:MAG: hypothetical protein WCO61_09775 [Alphaproteobacteria bacterium]